MSTTVSLIVIRTRDLAATRAFYEAVNLDFIEEQHGAGPQHLSCARAGLVLEIYPAKADAPELAPTTMLGFAVESLNETLAALQRLGVAPKSAPVTAAWGRFVNVVDSDGRTVQITERPA